MSAPIADVGATASVVGVSARWLQASRDRLPDFGADVLAGHTLGGKGCAQTLQIHANPHTIRSARHGVEEFDQPLPASRVLYFVIPRFSPTAKSAPGRVVESLGDQSTAVQPVSLLWRRRYLIRFDWHDILKNTGARQHSWRLRRRSVGARSGGLCTVALCFFQMFKQRGRSVS